MSDTLDLLRRMSRNGWTFTYPRDEQGEIIGGYAVRTWPGGWWDGLILHAEHHGQGVRADPDNHITWQREGTVLDMALALRDLPPPGERLAPALATGWHAPSLWLPGGVLSGVG